MAIRSDLGCALRDNMVITDSKLLRLRCRLLGLVAVTLVAVAPQIVFMDATPVALAAPDTYTVAHGDTLSGVASRFGVTVVNLVQANNLRSADFLQVGQLLIIPTDGSPSADQAADSAADFRLYVPYRTQFDGTRYQESNCGPAALGMILAYFGNWDSTDNLRRLVNQSTGNWSLEGGSDWRSIAYTVAAEGFSAIGPIDAPKVYHAWTLNELLQQVNQGQPAVLLVRYPYLPGHEGAAWWGDHYIVVIGQTNDGKIEYHDPAFTGTSTGAYRTMTQAQLTRAWGQTQEGISFSAMVLKRPEVDVIKGAQ